MAGSREGDLKDVIILLKSLFADPPLFPNPLLEQPSASALSLKWSPPFLWPGYYIRNYNISVRDNSGEEMSTYEVNSVAFNKAVITLQLNESYHTCMEFTFGIIPGHEELASQIHSVSGGYYARKSKV